ncbi:prepilin peptidase [Paenibacillus sp. J5C_2022]|uniref:A24 family peptidase n=1 Tax=Paenibacillus sp. J5C2022 TaxID=2977129 RepID=UPI0021D19C24|nr:prepilin peptidase [Paenibacillus sp. J5C2022]MCU6710907.1 prepilin peptidase [Paenibacillus sp. J5C2022]
MALPGLAAAILLAAAFVTDVRRQRIPNALTGGFFLAACLYALLSGGWQQLLQALLGAAAGFLPLLLLYVLKGIGAGDVKLFGATGAWLGIAAVLQLMIYAMLFGGLIGLTLLVLRKVRPGSRLACRSSFPFMLAVAPAGVALWMMVD